MRGWRLLSWLVPVAVLSAGCRDRPGPVDPSEAGLFGRYVALGNSITAGAESGGINDSTQANAYPVLIASRVGAPFSVAELRRPGCPPPLVGPAPLTDERVDGADPLSCAGVRLPIPQPLQSLAVPGFGIADALTVPEGVLGLIYRQIFGNRSLVQAMADANPTLVTVWLGNSDALGAATTGDVDQLTPLASFTASLSSIVSAMAGVPTLIDAVLIGVSNPLHAPLLQPGAYLWLVAQDPEGAALLGKPVSDTCAPVGPGAEPNPLAANLLSLSILADVGLAEVSCVDDAPYVVNEAEQAEITERVAAFNAAIRENAEANGWIYIDSNQEIITPLLADPEQIRKCQGLAAAATAEALRAAVEETCPRPTAQNFFGAALSFDGVHPSRAGQQVVADVLLAALEGKHGPDL